MNDSEANRQIFARTERLMATPGYRFENIDMRNLEEAAENFRIIYNKAWALFSGVKRMDKAQAQQLMRSMKSIIDPDIIIFAYFNDEPIGFFITVPDLNRLIGKFNGKFGWWQKLRLMWDLKVRRSCDRIFGIIFGLMWLLEDGGSTGSIQFDIRPRTTCIAAVMAAAIYILSSISYTQLNTPFSARGTMEIYTMRTVVYFGGVALLFAYQSQLRDLLTQREADALRNMLHIQYENYKIRQESIDLINQKYHDLKHQIAVLRAESGEKRNAVLDNMEQEIKAYEAQNDTGNKHSPTVIAAAITSQTGKARLPTHIELNAQSVGLSRDSVILLEQIRTIDKSRLRERMGKLDDTTMTKVDNAIAVSFGL